MTDGFKAPPILGYQDVSGDKQATVNLHKQMEERILRHLDELSKDAPALVDPRWLAVGRTHLEQAWMAINRAVFQPQRISLPEDSSV